MKVSKQQQIEIPSISSTHFTLFHASKACQTEIDEIQDTKDLALQLKGLHFEVENSVKALQSAYDAQVSRLTAGIIEKLDIKNSAMKRSYKDSIIRLDQAGRTELANGIAKLWRQFESKYENAALKIQTEHLKQIGELDDRIKEYRRKRLTNETIIGKNKVDVDRLSKMAKRAGFDLEGQFNEDKESSSQIEVLENLQRSLVEKDAQLASLKLQFQNEVEKQAKEKKLKTQQIRKQFRAASNKIKFVTRLFSVNPRGSVVTRQCSRRQSNFTSLSPRSSTSNEMQQSEMILVESNESNKMIVENSDSLPDFFLNDQILPDTDRLGVVSANDEPRDIEATLAEMEKEFEKEKEDELNMTRELEEEFRRNYTLLRAQAIKTKGWCFLKYHILLCY